MNFFERFMFRILKANTYLSAAYDYDLSHQIKKRNLCTPKNFVLHQKTISVVPIKMRKISLTFVLVGPVISASPNLEKQVWESLFSK